MKEFLKKLLGSGDEVSVKRFIGLAAFVIVAIIALVDLFSNLSVSAEVLDALMYIIIAAFFAGAFETYTKRGGRSPITTVNVDKVETVSVEAAKTEQPVEQIPN